mmetsp:Transcript_13866/g.25487  ORF Transcript_13866/g.25487 Transcript_13866/m.25487 type:complete len:205 (-) Transcript_13866:938-1552(-)
MAVLRFGWRHGEHERLMLPMHAGMGQDGRTHAHKLNGLQQHLESHHSVLLIAAGKVAHPVSGGNDKINDRQPDSRTGSRDEQTRHVAYPPTDPMVIRQLQHPQHGNHLEPDEHRQICSEAHQSRRRLVWNCPHGHHGLRSRQCQWSSVQRVKEQCDGFIDEESSHYGNDRHGEHEQEHHKSRPYAGHSTYSIITHLYSGDKEVN